MKIFWSVVAAIVAIIAIITIFSGESFQESPAQLAKRKQECVDAIMSSMGTSTKNYSDKQAYDEHVRKHCAGLEINGVPLDK